MAEMRCPKGSCGGTITEYDTSCKDCGSHFSPCIASGQSITAKAYYTCKTCKHKALHAELEILHLKHCTLCHGKIEEEAAPRAQPDINSGGGRARR